MGKIFNLDPAGEQQRRVHLRSGGGHKEKRLAHSLKGLRVLHIDDDPMMAELVKMMLEREGATVSSSSGGSSGVDALYDVLPNVVLLDLKMPLMDGFDVLHSMRAHSGMRECPVICLTGTTSRRDIEHAVRMGAEGYLFKPVDMNHLAMLVRCFSAGVTPEDRLETLLGDDRYSGVAGETRGKVESLLELEIIGVIGRAGGLALDLGHIARLADATREEAEPALASLETAGLISKNSGPPESPGTSLGDPTFVPARPAVRDGTWGRLMSIAEDPDKLVIFINLLCAGVLGGED